MNTISFKEIVKKIHPDLNPNIEDASEKMTTVLTYRNHPKHLYLLAVKWGLLSNNTQTVKKYEWVWKLFEGHVVHVNDRIYLYKKGFQVIVEKITPKRYYFTINGKRTFCLKKNAVLVKKVKVEV